MDVPWYSSYGSDFNYDFHVTLDESVAPPEYNYRTKDEHERAGTAHYLEGELPGTSYFLRDGDTVFHTYSNYARGAEMTGGSYYWLDLTALGRQEESPGRSRRAAPTAHAPPFPISRPDARLADAPARRAARRAGASGRYAEAPVRLRQPADPLVDLRGRHARVGQPECVFSPPSMKKSVPFTKDTPRSPAAVARAATSVPSGRSTHRK